MRRKPSNHHHNTMSLFQFNAYLAQEKQKQERATCCQDEREERNLLTGIEEVQLLATELDFHWQKEMIDQKKDLNFFEKNDRYELAETEEKVREAIKKQFNASHEKVQQRLRDAEKMRAQNEALDGLSGLFKESETTTTKKSARKPFSKPAPMRVAKQPLHKPKSSTVTGSSVFTHKRSGAIASMPEATASTEFVVVEKKTESAKASEPAAAAASSWTAWMPKLW